MLLETLLSKAGGVDGTRELTGCGMPHPDEGEKDANQAKRTYITTVCLIRVVFYLITT